MLTLVRNQKHQAAAETAPNHAPTGIESNNIQRKRITTQTPARMRSQAKNGLAKDFQHALQHGARNTKRSTVQAKARGMRMS